MATSTAVLKVVQQLAVFWPMAIDRLTSCEGWAIVATECLQEVEDDDLYEGLKLLAREEPSFDVNIPLRLKQAAEEAAKARKAVKAKADLKLQLETEEDQSRRKASEALASRALSPQLREIAERIARKGQDRTRSCGAKGWGAE